VSQVNVELVQSAYALWNAGDMTEDGAGRHFAPDVVMTTPPDWPDAIATNDRAATLGRLVENRSLFESDRLVPERWIDAGDCVIVPTHWCGIPKGGSAEVKLFVVPVYTVRGEQIVRLDWYSSVQQALEALGLAE
jgi:ketosteroid isomerase-like protein